MSSGCPQLQASMLRHGSPQLEGLHLLMSRLTMSKAPSQGAFSVRAAERCTWCGTKATTRKAWREPVLASDSPSSPCWPHVLLSLLRRTHACLVTGNRGLMIDGVPLSASGSPQPGPLASRPSTRPPASEALSGWNRALGSAHIKRVLTRTSTPSTSSPGAITTTPLKIQEHDHDACTLLPHVFDRERSPELEEF